MSASASLLLDLGGQSLLGLVLDEQACPLFESRRSLVTSESAERVEQDPEALVAAAQSLIDEARAAMAGPDQPRLSQVALAVQRGSIVCWDRSSGAALSPVLSWRDRRSLARLEPLLGQAEAIRQRTGLRFSPYAGAPKIAWCLSELPAVRSAAASGRLACAPLGSFLLARLLREQPLRVDHTLAQRSLLWSRADLAWDPWLLESFGIPLAVLPELVPSHARHGHLRGDASAPPLDLLIGDQNCLAWLDGHPDPDTLYINLGTGAFVLRPLHTLIDDARFQCSLLDEHQGGRWALEGSVHGAASALNWLQREHGVDLAPHSWGKLRRSFETPPLFLNRIDGLGSPWWQAGSQPCFVAINDAAATSPQALLLAVLESMAFLIRANVDAMAERLPPPRRIVVCGGLSQSGTLCALIADTLQCPVQRLRSVEGTALGLWCRLHEQALPPEHFETIAWDEQPALQQRYRQWLQHIA